MAEENKLDSSMLMALASVISRRLNLARQLGDEPTAYQGRRDYNLVLGYPDKPTIETYWGWYLRDGVAARVVDKPAEDTWRKPPKVSEDDDENTPFVKQWELLVDRLQVWSNLARLDRLAGIGKYGVMLIGAKSKNALSEPLEKGELDGQQDVLFLRPFSERGVLINTSVTDSQNARFGLPLTYSIDLDANAANTIVHWTRIIHFADNKIDSNVVGVPRLQRLLNRLLDILKVVGGGAEAAWQLMNPGKILGTKEGYKGVDPDDTAAIAAIERELENFAHDAFRVARLDGMEMTPIGPSQTPDIANQWSVLKEIVAITADIPQSVLFGSAAGELAAAKQDDKRWAGTVASRQRTVAEPLLRKFINRLVWGGGLPTPPRGYDVGSLEPDGDGRSWPALFELDALDEADISQKKASAADSLRNPVTGTTPLTPGEEREVLGVPAEPEPEAPRMLTLSANQEGVFIPTVGRKPTDEALELYADEITSLIFDAQNGVLERDEFQEEMRVVIGAAALALFLASSGKTETQLNEQDRQEIQDFQTANLDALRGLTDDIYLRGLFTDDAGETNTTALNARISLWTVFSLNLVNAAYVLADELARYRWDLGATFEHCVDCLRLNGQVHTGRQWRRSGWLPQSRRLDCNGWLCDCVLRRTNEPLRGSF